MKDFDFDPEPASGPLSGRVSVPRELADLTVWKKRPFDAGHAIGDLFMKANTEAGSYKYPGGLVVMYQPGWVLWSNKALAERWGWTRETVEKFLGELERCEVIQRVEVGQSRRVIILVDYDTRTAPVLTPEQAAERQPNSHQTGQQNDTVGVGDKGEGEGGEPTGCPPRIITQQIVTRYFTQASAGYSEEEIRSEWLYFDSRRGPNGEWLTERGQVISDWRSAMERALLTGRRRGMGKNGEKSESTWESVQRLERLREQLAQHPANENSTAFVGEPTEDERTDLEELQRKIVECEKRLTEVLA